MASKKASNFSGIPPEWATSSGINPTIITVCGPEVAKDIADAVEQGLDTTTALELCGVPEATFREWVSAASKGEAPFVWAISMIRKALASYLYNQVLNLEMASGNDYRKPLEILRLRHARVWGQGQGGIEEDEADILGEFL